MILSGELPDLLLLLREERCHIRSTLHLVRLSVGSDDGIELFGAEFLQEFLSFKRVFTSISLPHTMIKTDAVRAPVRKKSRIARAVNRIVYISVTVHLKPVNVFLLRQTKDIPHRRKDNHPLFQLVITESYLIINHTKITDTALIHICTAFIIRNVIPQ